MTLLYFFLYLILLHWLGDFVLQSHWMAVNKSKNFAALSLHVLVYTATLFVGVVACLIALGTPIALALIAAGLYAAINGILHLGVDVFTSRWTSYLFRKGDYHNFFVVVGLDQLIHYGTLAATLIYGINIAQYMVPII